MTKVTVNWKASDALIRRELLERGEALPSSRSLELDLTTLEPEQRAALLKLSQPGEMTGPISRITLSPIDLLSIRRPTAERQPGGYYYRQESITFDAEPALEQVLATAADIAEARAQLAAATAQRDADQKAQTERLEELLSQAYADIRSLDKAADLAGLKAYRVPPELAIAGHQQRRYDLSQEIDDAVKRLIAAQREADKKAWIESHGSDHLRRAYAAGYNCQRLYVTERAALEAPGYLVDFDDNATWKDRSCPSPAALDLEEQATRAGFPGVMTVWLTRAPGAQPDPNAYADDTRAMEAVVIPSYLGRYDLVRVVA